MRVLIERGDIFLMRSDIPHCGCENFTDRTHYRIHVFCEEVKTDDIATSYGGSARKSSRPFPPGPYFDTITGLFHYGRRIYQSIIFVFMLNITCSVKLYVLSPNIIKYSIITV